LDSLSRNCIQQLEKLPGKRRRKPASPVRRRLPAIALPKNCRFAISCIGFCDAFNMDFLSLNDDSKSGRVTGRRHREEGVATKARTSR